MKFLAFGDVHGQIDNIGKIEGIAEASLIIITGDLTTAGGIKQAQRVIERVKQYNHKVYAQAGNMDLPEVEEYLIEQGISLHGQAISIEDVGIFGVGGSGPTPFHTPNELNEDEIASLILRGYQKIQDNPFKLFISHAPPQNTKVDQTLRGQHAGSSAVREFIEKYQPDLCLTGHIHEARGVDHIGRTSIINPGMIKNRGYVEILKEKGSLTAILKQVI